MTNAQIEKPEHKPNAKQQECIDNIEGQYLVLAGPGTGKTFTVTQRIKAMLEKGINPERILCLTFSETAAGEMKNKLIKALGGKDTTINIYTYHGFCNEIIGNYAELFELPENYRIISAPVSKQFLKECIEEFNPKYYRNQKNDPYVYLKQISDKISEIKQYRYTKEEYLNNIEKHPDWKPAKYELMEKLAQLKENPNSKQQDIEKVQSSIEAVDTKIGKALEIWEYYELYRTKMEAHNYIDFDDMITFVLDKFESSPDFLDKIAEKYDYIMVDEYQDTNDSQNKIIFNLASVCPNVFVVGDDDQIIFSFQGANLDTIQGFLKQFPNTKVICLQENMRSTQNILDVARSVAKEDDRRLEINPEFKHFGINKDLVAVNKDLPNQDRKVRCTIYQDEEQELCEIVDEIERLVNSDECPKDETGKCLKEIAVLATGHDQLGWFAERLKDRNIPVELKDGKSIFEIKASITLFYYLQMLVNPELYSDKIFKLLLLPPFQINPLDFAKIYKKITVHKTFIESMRSIDAWEDGEKVEKFLSTYDELLKFLSTETVRNIVMEVGARTGIFEYFLNEEINKNDNIAGLKKIMDEANDFSQIHSKIGLEDFVEYLLMVQADRDLDIKTDKPAVMMNAVQLTTYHSSKGKEYEYVYMPTLQRGKWESSPASFKPTIPVGFDKYKTDEEWRLYKISDRVKMMYVGMTRAKHTLRLSYVLNSGKKGNPPSEWIVNAQNLMDVVPTEERNLETVFYTARKALTKRAYDYKRDFKALVQARMEKRVASPTMLNTYQGCPRKFLYADILKFEARLGFADAANYGTAVHEACEFMASEGLKKQAYPTKEDFIAKFKDALDKLPMSTFEKRGMYEQRGEKELDKYYHILTNTSVKNLFATEFEIDTEVDGIKFYGRADKIEKNDDGTFNIIDYKTSEYQNEKAISYDGKHKDYYTQMCLYKYFFEKQTGGKVKNTTFVFPIDCSSTPLTLTEEECERVVEDLKQSIKDINDCRFEPNYDSEACKYCGYKDFCKLEVV